jgi:trans-2,3-dihydro-3-hydroxyanthranilate isomerase
MPTLHYLHLDVFTDRLFGGNQLAVYLDPPHDLPTATMQAIAREMAFSETTFVFPGAADQAWRVRIFTPASELPMAGHPTIGTAFALAHAGRVAPGTPRIVLEEGVGPVPVDLEWTGDRVGFAWMTQPSPRFGALVETLAGFGKAINVAVAEMRPHGWPVQIVSCGVPYLVIPVVSRAAVDRAIPDASAHARAFASADMPETSAYLFTMEPGPDGADVYARMFAPEIGIMEDAATGSAAGPLGAYLVHHGIVEPGRTLRILQGVRLGRPSWIHAKAAVEGPIPALPGDIAIAGMRVGGESVLAGEGALVLPG